MPKRCSLIQISIQKEKSTISPYSTYNNLPLSIGIYKAYEKQRGTCENIREHAHKPKKLLYLNFQMSATGVDTLQWRYFRDAPIIAESWE